MYSITRFNLCVHIAMNPNDRVDSNYEYPYGHCCFLYIIYVAKSVAQSCNTTDYSNKNCGNPGENIPLLVAPIAKFVTGDFQFGFLKVCRLRVCHDAAPLLGIPICPLDLKGGAQSL